MTSRHAHWPGVLMACSSAICYSTLTIFVKLAYTYNLNVITIVVLRMLFVSAQKLFAAGHLGLDHAAHRGGFSDAGLEQPAALCRNLIARLADDAGHRLLPTYALLLYFGAIGRIGAARTALISTIEPVSTAVIATSVLNERFTSWQVFGAALILSGLVALEWQSVKRNP